MKNRNIKINVFLSEGEKQLLLENVELVVFDGKKMAEY